MQPCATRVNILADTASTAATTACAASSANSGTSLLLPGFTSHAHELTGIQFYRAEAEALRHAAQQQG